MFKSLHYYILAAFCWFQRIMTAHCISRVVYLLTYNHSQMTNNDSDICTMIGWLAHCIAILNLSSVSGHVMRL